MRIKVPDFVPAEGIWLDTILISILVAVLTWGVLKLYWLRGEWVNEVQRSGAVQTSKSLQLRPTIVRRVPPPHTGVGRTKQGSKFKLEQSKNRAQLKPDHGAPGHTAVLPPPIPGLDLHPNTGSSKYGRETTGFYVENMGENEAQTVSSEALSFWLDQGD